MGDRSSPLVRSVGGAGGDDVDVAAAAQADGCSTVAVAAVARSLLTGGRCCPRLQRLVSVPATHALSSTCPVAVKQAAVAPANGCSPSPVCGSRACAPFPR